MMKENLHVVSEQQPYSWIQKADFLPDIQFPWDDVSVAPKINVRFQMYIKWKRLKRLDLDYFSGTPIISEKFADLCKEQGVSCQLVPLDIFLNGNRVDDKFYFLLLNKFLSIIDMEKTPHVRMMTVDGKNYEINKFFPEIPCYDMVKNIVPNDLERHPFFMAPEIGYERVCTQSFKEFVEKKGVKGIKFLPIDDSFEYKSLGYNPKFVATPQGWVRVSE